MLIKWQNPQYSYSKLSIKKLQNKKCETFALKLLPRFIKLMQWYDI